MVVIIPATCQYNKPVNGTCSTAKNTCSAGTFKDTADSGTHDKWSCEGRYEGATVFCQKGIAVNGFCSGYKDTCSKGTWADGTDTGTHYKWSCSGVHGGSTAQCQSAIVNNGNTPTPVNGACNSLVANACSAGSFTDVSDTPSKYKWKCTGLDGGTDASCQMTKPVNGTCGTTDKNKLYEYARR